MIPKILHMVFLGGSPMLVAKDQNHYIISGSDPPPYSIYLDESPCGYPRTSIHQEP